METNAAFPLALLAGLDCMGGVILDDRIRDVHDFHHPHPEGSSTERTEALEEGTRA